MSLRPHRTRWFELLTPRIDLAAALETLAATGEVELETRSSDHAPLNLAPLQQKLDDYQRLAQRYQPYWPDTVAATGPLTERPSQILDNALRQLHDWEAQARPLVSELERLGRERDELQALAGMLRNIRSDTLDYELLSGNGPTLRARLFELPAKTRLGQLPGSVLVSRSHTARRDYLLTVGTTDGIEALATELSALKARPLQLPVNLRGNRQDVLKQLHTRLAEVSQQDAALHAQLDAVADACQLHAALADCRRLEWVITHAASLPATENFAWVTGWSSDPDGTRLRQALAAAGIRAMINYPPAPTESVVPTVLKNPGWARPFELFTRMLGTPEANEADPSLLVAVLAPLLFGYMFGDIGHGLVLVAAGLLLQRRWPVTRILVANGLAAMLFGLVFGSVFGREDLIPALWVHPIEHPLPVLLVPLAGGVVILLLGLVLNAFEARWRGELHRWLQVDAALLALYLSLISSFWSAYSGLFISAALVWYFVGSLLQPGQAGLAGLLHAAGTLIESLFQLLVNTISFVRVGAFALAHAGLSLAFMTLADTTGNAVAAASILLVGNLVVILLEGLVVTIQTTRLILFEFFIRFLQCRGRTFRPLSAPAASGVNPRRST